MNLKKRGYCLLLILSLQLAVLFAFNDNSSKGFIILDNEIIYDFESSLDEWEPSLVTEGSAFELTSVDPFNGNSSAKLIGRTRYYHPIANYVTLNFTPSTTMNFSWKYDNIDGYYFGILLACEGPDIWFIHKFSSSYVNNSNYLVIEYSAENISEWYSHSVNIYDLYMDYYGYLPTKITSVHVHNRGYGAATGTTPSSQISYYDSIKIGDLDITIPPSSKPEISLLSPTNNSKVRPNTDIYVSIIDVDLQTVNYNWDNLSNNTWTTPYTTIVPETNGQHFLNIYACSYDGNSSYCKFVFITDDTLPIIELLSPEPFSTVSPGTNVVLNITDDVGFLSGLYNWDNNINLSLTLPILEPVSLAIPATPGEHSLEVFAEDTDHNWIYAEYIIFVGEPIDWLIMIYLDGDNDLEEYAIIDFNELEEGYSDLSSIEIIVLFDRILGYDESNNDWTETRLYQIENDVTININSLLLENKGELNMASSASLSYLVNYGFQNFNAEHYWLNIWNHGAAVDGVCIDETNSYDMLTLEEMQIAINTSEEEFNKDLDLISIDACNMGMIEVAYEMRELTDYFVASEETIPLDGFDYYTIISRLIATPTSPAISLVNFIIESYEDYYSIQSYSTTISAFNLSTELIIDLRLSIDVLADALLTAINDSYGSIIEEAFFNTQTFSYSYTIDLVDFLNALANSTLQVNYPEIQAKILLLKMVLNKIIFQNYHHDSFNGRANGASIFMPYYDASYVQSIDDYISSVNSFMGMDWQSDTLWEEFLFYFYSNGFGQGIPGLIQIKFDEPTGTIAIDEDEEHLYYFVVDNIGVYEITAEISSGDSDIYLIDYSSFSLLGYSLLVNPDDGNKEIMRFLLSPGTYLVEVYGFTTSVYNLEVTESEIPPLLFDSIITEESGTQEGTDDGHYLQTVSFFYTLIIPTQGSYEIRLLYDSSEVDFDLYVYLEDFTRLDYSINTGDLDSILLDINEPKLLFVKVYGYSGKGQFTLQAINKNTNTPTTSTTPTTSPTPSVGLIIIPFIFLASSLVIILIYVKRKRQ